MLLQVLINAVSHAMGRTLTFEESGEAVYAAMVKVRVSKHDNCASGNVCAEHF